MQSYSPPISDYRFLLEEVFGFNEEMECLGRDLDADTAVTILAEAGKFCAGRLHGLNRVGDEVGCVLRNGEVTTPPGFAEAYEEFRIAGWSSLSGDPEWGGQGLPFILQLWFDEMLAATNLSFGLFPGLTRGAAEAIATHASDELKEIYLPRMIAGDWSGVMALTEAGAGTDLALLKTKAAPQPDGSYRITGQKIFISSGDHDFGGNIVHLVLARLPDAPLGVQGISLFLVPKYLSDEAGTPGLRNAVSVGSLEEKMGIHAQPTCVMNYDDATGWLIGVPHRGLAAMFTMMNAERLVVGIQGLGVAGAAYQQAAAYARERLQGRSADNRRAPVPIIEHPDVRRMLLSIRSFVEGGRALAGWLALQLDRARTHPDADERRLADGFVALLTPVVKAAFTDLGFEGAVAAQQVFGGHGYVRDWGMEQYVRDARITQIYEGTNGAQAIDLVGRKLGLAEGAVVTAFLDLIASELTEAADIGSAAAIVAAVNDALHLLRGATAELQGADPLTVGAAANEYLRLFALTCLGWMWVRMASVSQDGTTLHQEKRELARFYAARIMPQTSSLAAIIKAGPSTLVTMNADDF